MFTKFAIYILNFIAMKAEEILFFDKLSESWDEKEMLSTQDKVREIINLSGVSKGMKILDLGTGTGILIPYLIEKIGDEGSIKAVDISSGMLSKAEKKYGHFVNVDFELKDFENSEIEGKYNLIFLYCVYPHLHEPMNTLRKLMERNLDADGKIIIAFPTDEHFINNIHKEKKAESDLLPSAHLLVKMLNNRGFNSHVVAYNPTTYIVEIIRN